MIFQKRRDALRLILTGSRCIRPGSVYDAISIRIAEDLGFEVGMFGGRGFVRGAWGSRRHPDHADRTRRADAADVARCRVAGAGRCRSRLWQCAECPPHGAGVEMAGAAGLTIEDTLLPQAFGQTGTQLISIEEGVGKMKAAVDARGDPGWSSWREAALHRSQVSMTRPRAW